MNTSRQKKILFICTGNSCRSQLAEALTNQDHSPAWKAFSAGTRPAQVVHPTALQVLREVGIDHKGTSKGMDGFLECEFDLVVTVCAEADRECPNWPGSGERVHFPYPDPSEVKGNSREVLQAFRNVRDQIRSDLRRILADWNKRKD